MDCELARYTITVNRLISPQDLYLRVSNVNKDFNLWKICKLGRVWLAHQQRVGLLSCCLGQSSDLLDDIFVACNT